MEPFGLPFFREALLEILILAIPCGLIGSWIVLRGQAFHAHAVGTATFPGLVIAEGLGVAAFPAAVATALVFSVSSAAIGRRRRTGADTVTALALAGFLAVGVILASNVFGSGANVDTLLFGSLLAIAPTDLWLAAAVAGIAVVASAVVGHQWLARGFDPEAGERIRPGSGWCDAVLLVVVALVVVISLGAVGALLVSALVVVPAASVRLFARRIATLQAGAVALVAAEGAFGLWLSAGTDAPPGATIAVTSGVVFFAMLASRAAGRTARPWLRVVPGAAILVVFALIGIAAGGGPDQPPGTGPRVVATTTQVGDLVRQAGGDDVRLTTILAPNTDPHEYEPRPSDVQAISEADLVFRSGGTLDAWTEGLLADSASSARVTVLARSATQVPGGDGRPDPHWWQDPLNAAAATRRIGQVLGRENPAGLSGYRRRVRSFRDETRQLTARIRSCLAEIPPGRRKIVTDHDAFGYFTGRFGIETVGTMSPALSSRAEPSARDLAQLERTVRRENVRAVFPERTASPALAEAIARDTGARVGTLLYGDSLGPPGSPGSSLLGSIRANADALIEGMSDGRINCFGGFDDR